MIKSVVAAILFVMTSATMAAADPEATAKTFITDGVDQAITILKETKPDDPARAARFRDFVSQVID
ncbi:MAG: hypothetical protein AAFY01_02045, partial [Pseudomonadota bacterium]